MRFGNYKQYYSVLTNGETTLEIHGSRHGCGVDPGCHVFGQDGFGNLFIDGKPAHIEIRIKEWED